MGVATRAASVSFSAHKLQGQTCAGGQSNVHVPCSQPVLWIAVGVRHESGKPTSQALMAFLCDEHVNEEETEEYYNIQAASRSEQFAELMQLAGEIAHKVPGVHPLIDEEAQTVLWTFDGA